GILGWRMAFCPAGFRFGSVRLVAAVQPGLTHGRPTWLAHRLRRSPGWFECHVEHPPDSAFPSGWRRAGDGLRPHSLHAGIALAHAKIDQYSLVTSVWSFSAVRMATENLESVRVAVVVPCYRVSRQVLQLLARIGPEVDRIYVVDDACPESSGAL